MITRLRVKNFKMLDYIDIPLDSNVVFIGPNNSGKTTALQALSLWDVGLRTWLSRRGQESGAKIRTGITINRKDLVSLPIPNANLLWRDMHVTSQDKDPSGQRKTNPIFIEILVNGQNDTDEWEVGLEFYYANPESFYCRPLRRTEDEGNKASLNIPEEIPRFAFLPPMSGLASREPKHEPGWINVLIGEGQTAQVLRNLCYQLFSRDDQQATWNKLARNISELFQATLLDPRHDSARGELSLSYRHRNTKQDFDISASGRGLQQTLLLLAYLYANPKTTILLDEPDAHLEILRQRQTYRLITEIARNQGAQIIAASHSEIVLDEASEKDIVIAFVGRPHRIEGKVSQLRKSLTNIELKDYYAAEEQGWVLYLEGSTDLDILQAFAKKLDHPVQECLSKLFVYYVGSNHAPKVKDHFFGLSEAKSDLVGLALFNRVEGQKSSTELDKLFFLYWKRREIENYIYTEEILLRYAYGKPKHDLLEPLIAEKRKEQMSECIAEVSNAFKIINKPSPWSEDIKASDEFLDIIFPKFQEKAGIHTLRKKNYSELVEFFDPEDIPEEVISKLDAIEAVARRATKATYG